jgi:hypothetical protein
MSWVNAALGEIYSRTTGLTTRRTVHFSITSAATGVVAWEIQEICPNFVSPVSLLIVLQSASNNQFYAPVYLPPAEFFRTCSWKTATSSAANIDWYTISRIGTNVPDTGVQNLKALTLYTDPGIATSTTRWCYLTYVASPTWQSTSTNYIECFPHWEHVVVWKAAEIGARALKHRLYDIFRLEAAHAIQTMYTVEKYQPDSVVFSRGAEGNLAGTRRFGYTLPQKIE